MDCPACNNKLAEIKAGNVAVDVCRNGCGGVWFDQREILAFDENSEIEGEQLINVSRGTDSVRKKNPRACPRCTGQVLVRQFFDPKSQVEIDLCWGCGGVWLDTGELKTVRNQFANAAERSKAGDAFVSEVLEQHKKVVTAATKEELANYNERYKNRFHSLVSSFRDLLDPVGDGLLK